MGVVVRAIFALAEVLKFVSRPPKQPKGMHWTTYERKLGKVHQLTDELSTILGVYKRLRERHGDEIAKQLDKAQGRIYTA